MSAIVYSLARQILALRQAPVEHVELALHLHREAVDRVFDLGRRVGVEVAEAAAEIGRAAHLPEQPRQAFGARRWPSVGRKAPNFSARCSRIAPDSNTRIGFGPLRSISAGILEFGLTATKPLPNWSPVDPDQPGIVLGAAVAERQQLLQHHRDLHAVRRAPANRAAADGGRPAAPCRASVRRSGG